MALDPSNSCNLDQLALKWLIIVSAHNIVWCVYWWQKRIFVEPFLNLNDPIEIDLLYHQSVTDVFDQKIPLTKADAVRTPSLYTLGQWHHFLLLSVVNAADAIL